MSYLSSVWENNNSNKITLRNVITKNINFKFEFVIDFISW